jgi:glyoxalase family protein
MSFEASGIHHVTAIAGNPQRNLDFYAGVLGLRLVKKTVNFDDPTTYHFYYGNETGSPGSVLTFFPWPDARRGRQGAGQVAVTGLSIMPGSVGFWLDRLLQNHVHFESPVGRFDSERVVALKDPDGLMLELIAHPSAESHTGWGGGPIPREHAIRGVYAVTLWEEGYESTARILSDGLGFRPEREQGSIYRYVARGEGPGRVVDVRCVPGLWRGVMGAGAVHHVAFRAPNGDVQIGVRESLAASGVNVTPVLDRKYFQSIYFREPGGVLFEVATDGPGFTADEPLSKLGSTLQLPLWLEERRFEIEALLPNLQMPVEIHGPNA